MKNRNTFLPIFLLFGGSLIYQSFIHSSHGAAAADFGVRMPAGVIARDVVAPEALRKGVDIADGIEAGEVLVGPAFNEVYNTKINVGEKRVGIEFRELVEALKQIAGLNDYDLYSNLLGHIREAIYNNTDNLGRNALIRLGSLQRELKRLETSGDLSQIRFFKDRETKKPDESMKTNLVWPLLVWAIENDNAKLAGKLTYIVGSTTKKPYGRENTALEIATFLGSKKASAAILASQRLEGFARRQGANRMPDGKFQL